MNKYLIIFAIVWVLGFLLVRLFLRSKQPKINPLEIMHEEKWQTGASYSNLLAVLRGVSGSFINIKFLKNRIIIRPHFPFDLLVIVCYMLLKDFAFWIIIIVNRLNALIFGKNLIRVYLLILLICVKAIKF